MNSPKSPRSPKRTRTKGKEAKARDKAKEDEQPEKEEGPPLNRKDLNGRTPADNAFANGNESLTVELLSRGGIFGDGALNLGKASKGTFLPITRANVALLVNGKADFEASFEGRKPILWCAERGDEIGLHALIGLKANPGVIDSDGRNGIHLTGNAEIIKALIKLNVDPRAQDRNLDEPLHTAARAGRFEAVRELLRTSGLDYHCLNGENKRPADLAREAGFEEVATVLERGVISSRRNSEAEFDDKPLAWGTLD
jgi:ankyrin repeat protein